MPKTLLSFILSRLERLESPILRHSEIKGFPQADRKAILRRGVLVETKPAESVLLRSRRGSGMAVAVRKTSRGWVGVDEQDEFFMPVPLDDGDVRQYTVAVPRLVELLRQENSLSGDGCAEEYGLISVGQRHIDGVGLVDVYLSLANYDAATFAARCRHLQRPVGVGKVVLLVPRNVTLTATVRNALNTAGVVIAPLWRAAESGSLAIDWHSVAMPGATQDGLLSPRKIVWLGRAHACELTKAEATFLASFLTVDEIDIHQVMHTRKGAVIRGRYQSTKQPRDRVHKFLSRLNGKLVNADPSLPISFSLPRGRDTIVRDLSKAGKQPKPR